MNEKVKRKKKIIVCVFTIFLIIVVGVRIINNINFEYRNVQESESSCVIYYLLNIDGMKGLGHSSFMLVDEQGQGVFYSYNGMQYSLFQSLAGKSGVGKMKCFELSEQEVSAFLATGDLQVSDVSECDNFDRALYRYLSKEECDKVMRAVEVYIQVGNEYEALYAELHNSAEDASDDAEAKFTAFLEKEDLPRYQIYQHNCDTVAREMIALIDEDVKEYNDSGVKLTPAGNYMRMSRMLGEHWGCKKLGADSVIEKILWWFFPTFI